MGEGEGIRSPIKAESALLLTVCWLCPLTVVLLHVVSCVCVREREEMAYQRSPTKAESALLLTACLALPIDCGALHVSQLCVCERERERAWPIKGLLQKLSQHCCSLHAWLCPLTVVLYMCHSCVCVREGMAYQRSPTKAESALLLTACLALAIDHLDALLAKCDATN